MEKQLRARSVSPHLSKRNKAKAKIEMTPVMDPARPMGENEALHKYSKNVPGVTMIGKRP